ncbi:type A2 lantipeptide [Dolosigranulum pigrum]|uniref:Lantibiotic n=1 Tax=Dolosigranulum pigrum TaxID=29394 RepID=A0A516GLG3_9LACT|nr:type A2 lantipeptide [Dolosigranulum pigrum]
MQEKRQQLVRVVSDTELEVLIGGKGPGLVKTF